MRRVGHKGADALVPGNTIASFRAASELGVDTVELDVLGLEDGRVVVAHDFADAARREPHTLFEVLDAFLEPPLDRLELDLDLKRAGYEREVVEAVRSRGITRRAMVSTMEVESLARLAELEPELRRGLTIPKVGRDWTRSRLLRPLVRLGVAGLSRRLPATVAARAEELELSFLWPFQGIVGTELTEQAHASGLELIAWTVDDRRRITELIELGVDGICSNDPRLISEVAGRAPGPRG